MDAQIIVTLIILLVAVLLFVTEKLRIDLVALLVLSTLALSGLVSPVEAVSGFSNPVVITVWAVFILSAGMARTGVASTVGRVVLRLAGRNEARLVVVIMLTASIMSAFMNNVGVAALLLPVVMDIARKTGRRPARLLIPLSFGCLLGGLTTLIGTPPNLLVSNALRDAGQAPFAMFDFAPFGIIVMLVGIAYMVLVGRHLLPGHAPSEEQRYLDAQALGQIYDMQERLFILRLPLDSPFIGRTLSESRLGTLLGINVIGILRDQQTDLAPLSSTRLLPGDRLLVAGRQDWLREMSASQHLELEAQNLTLEDLITADVSVAEVQLAPNSPLVGRSLLQLDFRRQFQVVVLALWRNGEPIRTGLDSLPLQGGDVMLVQGCPESFDQLDASEHFNLMSSDRAAQYDLDAYLLRLHIPAGSALVGKSLAESRLADAFDLSVLGIISTGGETRLMPAADSLLQADDHLLVKGQRENLLSLSGLQSLEIDTQAAPALAALDSEQFGMVEIVLSPHTTLIGKTLSQLHFREKYGLSVLAIWRGDRAYRHNLRSMKLRFGDALLVFGSRQHIKLLASEPDFIVLQEEIREPLRLKKAPIAFGLMVAVVTFVALGWLPISVAAVAGAALMILTGCLTMDEAYRHIEWRAVFLIAGMLPLGIALEHSGAASLIAGQIVNLVAGWGATALLGALFLLTSLMAQVMPTPVVAVLMAPIAIQTGFQIGISPQSLAMVIAVAASASFLSPVGHPANVLVMGPGGYRFTDYLKVGVPLVTLILVLIVFVLPWIWPPGL
ncbi:MAG: SLC13 family permease [Anaerolineales bacterium]|nr:SLC13 family permease [Anaerolineales bacterium]